MLGLIQHLLTLCIIDNHVNARLAYEIYQCLASLLFFGGISTYPEKTHKICWILLRFAKFLAKRLQKTKIMGSGSANVWRFFVTLHIILKKAIKTA